MTDTPSPASDAIPEMVPNAEDRTRAIQSPYYIWSVAYADANRAIERAYRDGVLAERRRATQPPSPAVTAGASAEDIARRMVAEWEHGSDAHRAWLREMCVPEIAAALRDAEARALRACLQIAHDHCWMPALGSFHVNDAYAIYKAISALAAPREGK